METQAVVQKNASRYLLLAQRWKAQLFGLLRLLASVLLTASCQLRAQTARTRPHRCECSCETLPVIVFSIDASVETVCAAFASDAH